MIPFDMPRQSSDKCQDTDRKRKRKMMPSCKIYMYLVFKQTYYDSVNLSYVTYDVIFIKYLFCYQNCKYINTDTAIYILTYAKVLIIAS